MRLNKMKLLFIVIIINVSQPTISGENAMDNRKSSLAFVFDITGSMHDDLRQLKDGAELILDTAMKESDMIGNFVFVPFHDPEVGPSTVTKDKKVFKDALERVSHVYGGGDCPEMSLGGIQIALNVSGPRSFVYVFTDATAKDYELVGKVLDAVQRKHTQVVFVLTGNCKDLQKPTYKAYQQIAAASSGQIFNLNKTSVHEVLDFVKSSLKGRTVNLGSSVVPGGREVTHKIPVDSALDEVTVSVSGSNPQISVVSPAGEHITGPPKLVKTLDLSEIVVVKVLQPEPGSWQISAGSEDDFSVKVVGLSNLTFSYGFSVQPTGNMADTYYRPLQGPYNQMLIQLSHPDSPVLLDYAEILTLEGKLLYYLPLSQLNGSAAYSAEQFIPPEEFFYVAIHGRDENNNEFRRIGPTAVQSTLPDVPQLTVPQKIEGRRHSRVVVTCHVSSIVPVTAKWTKEASRIQKDISSLQTVTIEYVIEDLTEDSVDNYRCVAKNAAGYSTANTEVILLVEPPVVALEPKNLAIEKGDRLDVSCTVFSEEKPLKLQFVHTSNGSREVFETGLKYNIDGVYTNNITVANASESDGGNYTCIAVNRGGSSNETATIHITPSPTAHILGSHTLTSLCHSIVTLYCLAEHSNVVTWVNNGVVMKQVGVNGTHTDALVVNVTDDGDWTCKAGRGRFEASDAVHISVILKPVVTIEGSRSVAVLNGTVHEIVCGVVAKPAPRVLWYRGSEEKFLNHTMTTLDEKTYKSVLQLNSSAQNIQGSYFCVGENLAGIHQDSIDVTVRTTLKLLRGFNDTSVQLYSQLELQCDFDAYPTPLITWYHNGTELTSNENLYLSEDDKVLSIPRVDFNVLGLYSCEGRNSFEKMKVNGTLTVFGLDGPVLIKDEPRKRTVKQGTSTVITCRLEKGSPEPTVKLEYKSASSANFTSLRDQAGGFISELNISNVTVDNTGVYKCVADNVVGKDEFEIVLDVFYPPQLKLASQNMDDKPLQVPAGESVTFSCDSVSVPPPLVTWTKDGRSVYGERFKLDEGSLTINKVNVYDSGLFTCTVKNSVGSVQKNYTLFVYVAPTVTPPKTSRDIETVEGQLVELPCEASGVPSPAVVWRHNGDVLDDTTKYIDQFGIRFVANLTDFGNYTCVVMNQYGNTSLSYSVLIWVPPYIEAPLKVSHHVLLGTKVSLQCDVVGFPVPDIRWEFQGETLTQNTTDINFNDVGNLYLYNTTSKHEGEYSCVGQNLAGVARKVTYLNVDEPPKILEDNFTGPYLATNMDSALTIACRATGKPKPYVLWSKDESYLDKDARYEVESDGTLTIKSPTEDLSGSYTCTAKNSVGAYTRTVEVTVYSVPISVQSEGSHPVVTAVELSDTDIPCPARASHVHTLKWYKDATLISTGNLRIRNISREDQSTYACVVSNAVGSAYSAITLNVEWPPTFIDKNDKNNGNQNSKDNENNEKVTSQKDPKSAVIDYKTDIENDGTKVIEKLSNITNGDSSGEKKREAKEIGTVLKIVKGDDTYLDCSVDAKPMAKTKWLFNSKPIIFENRDRLKLMNVKAHNAGTYKCVVSNAYGTIVKEFRLDVLERPFISDFDVLDVSLMAGVNATLECTAGGSPTPTVQWTYNNTSWRVVNTSLTVSNIPPQAEGMYRCDARNPAGTAHLTYRVSVVSGARIQDVVVYSGGEGSSVNGSVEAKIGSNIRIACKASGKPAPSIQWLRNGKLLSENQNDINYADLTIDGVQSLHAGSYSCVVANKGGNDEKKIRLEVLEPPKIFQTLSNSEKNTGNPVIIEVLSGQAYYLHCHAYGNPVPQIYWFKDSLSLMLFDDSMVSTEFGEIIAVKKAMPAQTGNYTCVARNKVGNTTVVYLVDVLVPPPQPKQSSRPVTVRASRPLTLICPVEGSPTPSVMWNKHPYTEISENTPRVHLTEDNVTLTIKSTHVSDSGNYSCIMTNKAGTTEVTFHVTIEKPPSIAGDVGADNVERHEVALRKSIVLKCEADGHPLPSISWLKDTQALSDDLSNINRVLGNSLLAIWSATSRDAGQYICVVENSAGVVHRRYNVLVKVPGKWSGWNQWSYCNVTCGSGHQQRSRVCQYVGDDRLVVDKSSPSDKFVLDTSACKGPAEDRRKCHMPPCEDESSVSGWSGWSRWSQCSTTCGAGTQARTRKCTGHCAGDNVQIRICPNLPRCNNDRDVTDKEVLDSSENSLYAPEAVFEAKPEIENVPYSPDVQEFFMPTDNNNQNMEEYYDVNITSNLDGSDPGPCPVGYTQIVSKNTCEDIDECTIDSNACHTTQVCINTAGGYRCSCSAGLRSFGPGQRCMDINECTLNTHGCEYACVNVVGGYVCACPGDMRLHTDKHHCYYVSSKQALIHKQFMYEDDAEDYLSASIEYPARYKHMKNVQ